jgi:NAD(P)-dependent dehydrogenase (short-subunit alcohol dehydrogenase family)
MVSIADMTGKTVVITGGNSGIGLETAVALRRAGATTVITGRDEGRCRAALADLAARAGSGQADMVVFDLASLASVRDGATRVLELCPRIDVLINNAGVILSDRRETADGFEATFAVNHLGPFLLTQLLLDRVVASAPARIVNLTSDEHARAKDGLDFDDLQSSGHYRALAAYGRSKLANIYFTTELARRLAGTGVTVNCVHPGTVATGFGRDGDARGLIPIALTLMKPFISKADKGAETSVYLASSPDVAGVTGRYFVKCQAQTTSQAAQDDAAARRLWEISENMVAASTP